MALEDLTSNQLALLWRLNHGQYQLVPRQRGYAFWRSTNPWDQGRDPYNAVPVKDLEGLVELGYMVKVENYYLLNYDRWEEMHEIKKTDGQFVSAVDDVDHMEIIMPFDSPDDWRNRE